MKYTLVNTASALTAVSVLSILLHEAAHYLAAVALGIDATLYHNRVTGDTADSVMAVVVFAGSGPLFSLLLGLVAYHFGTRGTPGAGRLLLLYTGIGCIMGFIGYLMIGPFVPIGDTGAVFRALGLPFIVQVVIAVLAVITLVLFLRRAAGHFEPFALRPTDDNRVNRKRLAYAFILYPLFVSIIITSLLQLPVPHPISIMATVGPPMAMMMIFGELLGSKLPLAEGQPSASVHQRFNWPIISLLVVAIALNRLMVHGIG